LIQCIATSFGGNPSEFNPQDFLPVKLPDEENGDLVTLKRKLAPKTIEVLKRLKKNKIIPAIVMRNICSIKGMYELLHEEEE